MRFCKTRVFVRQVFVRKKTGCNTISPKGTSHFLLYETCGTFSSLLFFCGKDCLWKSFFYEIIASVMLPKKVSIRFLHGPHPLQVTVHALFWNKNITTHYSSFCCQQLKQMCPDIIMTHLKCIFVDDWNFDYAVLKCCCCVGLLHFNQSI